MEIKDNLLIIGPSYLRKNILEENKLKHNIKYIDEYELIDKNIYTYKDGVLSYLDKKENISPELCNIYLNNMYDIDINKNYKSKKLNKLSVIKKDLIDKGYIIFNDNFKKYLTNKDILVLNNHFDKRVSNIIKELDKVNHITYEEDKAPLKKDIIVKECQTLEDEVIFAATSIVDLINKGVDINNIYINKLSDDYKGVCIRIFDMYGIPTSFKKNSLYSIESVRNLLDNISLDDNILSINEKLGSLDSKLSNKLVSIFNKYVDFEYFRDVKEEIIYECKNTLVDLYPLDRSIKEVSYKTKYLNSNEYIFILGCNDASIPYVYKDDDFLSNEEKKELNLNSSLKLSRLEESYFIDYVNSNNVILSYKLKDTSSEYAPSSVFNKYSNFTKVNYWYGFDNKEINKLRLGSKLDNYFKYNEEDDTLYLLSNINLNYKDYDNNYTKINFDTIKRETNNKLNISTSLSDVYYGCKFRCLLNNIYKVEEFTPTVAQKIGLFFHDALCEYFKDGNDLDTIIESKLDKYFTDGTKKENFYKEKYSKSLNELVGIIEQHLNNTNFKNTFFEKRITVEKPNDLGIKITGVIDKILTFEDKDSTYVIVIDYKTGNPHDFRNAVYGIDMQLGFYFYLINHSNLFKNPKFGGMYLQKIMNDVLNYDKKRSYEEQLSNLSKLNGYTTDNAFIVSNIDTTLSPGDSSPFIGSLKLTKDGGFTKQSKVISDDTFKEVMDIISSKIESAITDINKCDFEINPKVLDGKNISCQYCTFKDICYRTHDNEVELDKTLKDNFLGGESNEDEAGK